MANNPQFKINQIAKDLGKKSKDIVELLVQNGVDVKNSQKTLEALEFDILFDTITKQNQITEIENYIDGITYIPSKEKAAPKEEQTPKAEPAPEKKAEKKPAEVKAEKTEEAPKPAPEKKPEAVKEAPKKAEAKPVETQKPAVTPKPQVKAEPKPVEKKPETQPKTPDNKPNDFRGAPRQNDFKPKDTRFSDRKDGQFRDNRGNRDNRDGGFGGRAGQQNGKPQNNRQGGGYSPMRDKDEGYQSAPREKFQPQQIIRAQTPKGGNPNQKKGGTRIVDMRDSNVDLSKYDDKLTSFVSESVADLRGGNQQFKKKNTGGQMQNNRNNNFKKNNKKPSAPAQPIKKVPVNVSLPEEIVVGELASRLKVTAAEVVKKLMLMGMMVTINQTIDYDTAYLVADEFGANITKEVVVTIEERLFDEAEDSEESLVGRAPVVCVMGHVDHGKTSLLDAIRNTHVTTGEAGGITQHIGAYRVNINGQDITFLDTPGHEAFTAMRARGAQATDIAILVVAADDGIMPQTVEAINHAKAAGIDIIVAINKMDKPTANPDNVKQELTKYDLVPEEWGGDVICVPVSALTHQGIDDLLENVLLVAEVKELKANPNRRAKGIVIEAKLDKGRGPVVTLLVQNGTLHVGDVVIAGTAVGRVRAMTDHTGRLLKEAGPSVPVEIIGLAEVPTAGDEFNAVADERMARELADNRRNKAKEEEFKANSRASLNDLFNQISEGVKDLNIIVKADVVGSAEAVKASLQKISNEEIRVKVIHSAVGGINEGDVMLAAASNAIIVGFNVRPDKGATDSAERQNVEIRTYRVIYDAIEEITAAMKGMLAPKYREAVIGHAEVRQTIHVPNIGTVAGSYIQDGKVTRSAQIRVVRDGIVIFEDKISSLRRFKDDVREVASGYECGIALEKFNDIKLGDILEAFIMEEIEQ